MADKAIEALMREQKSKIVEMSEENIAVCRRFCGTCPTRHAEKARRRRASSALLHPARLLR